MPEYGSLITVTELSLANPVNLVILSNMKLVTVALILLSALRASAQDNQVRLDTLRAEGYEALYNLDYEGARSRFKKMIDLAPDHPAGAQCYASSLVGATVE